MFNIDIKIYVPAPEINLAVQKRLIELGYGWRACGGEIKTNLSDKKWLYAYKIGVTTYDDSEVNFDMHDSKQVHYLQVLAGDLSGQLFKYTTGEGLVYYHIGGICWWYSYDGLYSTSYDFLRQLEKGKAYLVDVNENRIEEDFLDQNSEEEVLKVIPMPELIAGKHIIKLANGDKALVLSDGVLMFFDNSGHQCIRIEGWDEVAYCKQEITEVWEIGTDDYELDFELNLGGTNKRIWIKDDEREQLHKRYVKLRDQITELEKEVAEIKEKL